MTVDVRQEDLATAYQILGALEMGDHTYTHLSVRTSSKSAHFYINRFGLRFEEVTPTNLLTIDPDNMRAAPEYNQTGAILHQGIYGKRPDIQAIFHIHTPAIVAVSVLPDGLRPLSQWALHFYNRIAYVPYDSLALSPEKGEKIGRNLGTSGFVLMLRHHGAILCGRTIPEALFYTYHLQKSCETQCLIPPHVPLCTLRPVVCEQAVHDLLTFESDLGQRDWLAWKRWLKRQNGEPTEQSIKGPLPSGEGKTTARL